MRRVCAVVALLLLCANVSYGIPAANPYLDYEVLYPNFTFTGYNTSDGGFEYAFSPSYLTNLGGGAVDMLLDDTPFGSASHTGTQFEVVRAGNYHGLYSFPVTFPSDGTGWEFAVQMQQKASGDKGRVQVSVSRPIQGILKMRVDLSDQDDSKLENHTIYVPETNSSARHHMLLDFQEGDEFLLYFDSVLVHRMRSPSSYTPDSEDQFAFYLFRSANSSTSFAAYDGPYTVRAGPVRYFDNTTHDSLCSDQCGRQTDNFRCPQVNAPCDCDMNVLGAACNFSVATTTVRLKTCLFDDCTSCQTMDLDLLTCYAGTDEQSDPDIPNAPLCPAISPSSFGLSGKELSVRLLTGKQNASVSGGVFYRAYVDDVSGADNPGSCTLEEPGVKALTFNYQNGECSPLSLCLTDPGTFNAWGSLVPVCTADCDTYGDHVACLRPGGGCQCTPGWSGRVEDNCPDPVCLDDCRRMPNMQECSEPWGACTCASGYTLGASSSVFEPCVRDLTGYHPLSYDGRTAIYVPHDSSINMMLPSISLDGADIPVTSFYATGLPEGMTIDQDTGAISGKAKSGVGQTYQVDIVMNGTDSAQGEATLTMYFKVMGQHPTSVFYGANFVDLVNGQAVSLDVIEELERSGSGNCVGQGLLPAGLTVLENGTISGTPNATQPSLLHTVRCFGDDGIYVDGSLNISVSGAAVAPGTPTYPSIVEYNLEENAIFGFSDVHPRVPSTGTRPWTFSVASGTLPSGLSLNPDTGVIGGNPDSPSSGTVTIEVANSAGTGTAAAVEFVVGWRPLEQTLPYKASLDGRQVPTSVSIDHELDLEQVGSLLAGTFARYGNSLSGDHYAFNTTDGTLELDDEVPILSGHASFIVGHGLSEEFVAFSRVANSTVEPVRFRPAHIRGRMNEAVTYVAHIDIPGQIAIISAESLPAGFSVDAEEGVVRGQCASIFGRTDFKVSVTYLNPAVTVDGWLAIECKPIDVNSIVFGYIHSASSFKLQVPSTYQNFSYRMRATHSDFVDAWVDFTSNTLQLSNGFTFATSAGGLTNELGGVDSGFAGFYFFDNAGSATPGTWEWLADATWSNFRREPTPSLYRAVQGRDYYIVIPASNTATWPWSHGMLYGQLPVGVSLEDRAGAVEGLGVMPIRPHQVNVAHSNALNHTDLPLKVAVYAAKPVLRYLYPRNLHVLLENGQAEIIQARWEGTTFAPLRCQNDSVLPLGLTVDADSGTVQGTPTVDGDWQLQVKCATPAGDVYGNVRVEVVAAAATPSNIVYPSEVRVEVGDLVSVHPSGGEAGWTGTNIRFANGSTDIGGLTVHPVTGEVRGYAFGPINETFSVEVTASDSSTATFSFRLVAKAVPPILNYAQTDMWVSQGSTVTLYPEIVAGSRPIAFTWSGDDVTDWGLTPVPGTGRIHGAIKRPNAQSVDTLSFTIHARNSAGMQNTTITLRFDTSAHNITSFEYIGDLTGTYQANWGRDEPGDAVRWVPKVEGGSAPYTFSVSAGALPPGWALDPTNGVIHGESLWDNDYAFSVSVTNQVNQQTVALTGKTRCSGADDWGYGSANPLVVKDSVVYLPVVGRLTHSARFVLLTSLPDGLAVDRVTGAIYGSPTTVENVTTTIRAKVCGTNGNKQLHFEVVEKVVQPQTLHFTPFLTNVTADTAISVVRPVLGRGSVPVFYSAVSTLPAGLTLDRTTGVLSGTPVVEQDAKNVTLQACNSAGCTQANVSVQVLPPRSAPAIVGYAVGDAELTRTEYASNNALDWAGSTPVTFSVSPALPTGLSLNSNNGTIDGVPSVATERTAYTVRGTNDVGFAETTVYLRVAPVCSSAPNCLALRRENCSLGLTDDTCGECLAPTSGSSGPSNVNDCQDCSTAPTCAALFRESCGGLVGFGAAGDNLCGNCSTNYLGEAGPSGDECISCGNAPSCPDQNRQECGTGDVLVTDTCGPCLTGFLNDTRGIYGNETCADHRNRTIVLNIAGNYSVFDDNYEDFVVALARSLGINESQVHLVNNLSNTVNGYETTEATFVLSDAAGYFSPLRAFGLAEDLVSNGTLDDRITLNNDNDTLPGVASINGTISPLFLGGGSGGGGGGGGGGGMGIIIGAVCGALVVIIVLVWWFRRRRAAKAAVHPDQENLAVGHTANADPQSVSRRTVSISGSDSESAAKRSPLPKLPGL